MRSGTGVGQLQPIFYANEMLKTCIFLNDGKLMTEGRKKRLELFGCKFLKKFSTLINKGHALIEVLF